MLGPHVWPDEDVYYTVTAVKQPLGGCFQAVCMNAKSSASLQLMSNLAALKADNPIE